MRQISFVKTIVPFLLVSLLSLLGGWMIAHYGFDFRYFLYLIIFVAMIAVIAMGKKALYAGFMIWILMFLLGYRTIHITSYFGLHPLIVLLTLLSFIWLLVLRSEKNTKIKLSPLLWIFSIFWVWGFFTGIARRIPWDYMVSDALNFFFMIPLFMIVQYLSRQLRFWKDSMLAFLATGALISLFGVIDYYFPQVLRTIPGLVESNLEKLPSFSGFARAGFLFWGQTNAVLVLALALPMIWMVPHFYKSKRAILVTGILLTIFVLAIYISGTRNAWLMLLITSVFWFYFAFNVTGLALSAAFWFVASLFFTRQIWTLILSIYTPLTTGQVLDNSIQTRIFRQQDAFQLALQNPLGVGWAGSGWVHGDFAQVAANLGILAGVIFLLWYLSTLYRIWQRYRQMPKDAISQTLLLSFVLCGLLLATEGVEVLPQYVMPVWFIWALVEAYLQTVSAESTSIFKGKNAETINSFTHVQ